MWTRTEDNSVLDEAGKVIFQDLSFEFSQGFQAIEIFPGMGILQHYCASFIIGIGNGECFGRQGVEEGFFYPDIFFEGLVVVEVVMSDIAKEAAGIFQSCDPLLVDSMRTGLHKDMGTTFIRHLLQQRIEMKSVGCSMCGGNDPIANMILYRTK